MVSPKNIQECLNDALFYRTQARQLFKHGQINIRERALAENLAQHTLLKISQLSKDYGAHTQGYPEHQQAGL